MLELTRQEWFETLKDFDEKIIQETTKHVKKIYKDVPSISEFYEIAKSKEKARAAHCEHEAREAEKRKEHFLNEQKRDPAKKEAARQIIKDICKKLSVGRSVLREDDGRYYYSDV